jgi:hypothetical protein
MSSVENSEMNPMERIEKIFLAGAGKAQKRETPYDPRPSDVVIVGPAKSGTTWLQQILHQIRTKGDEDFKDIYAVTWWLPYRYVKYDLDLNAEQKANPRVFKSHDRYDMVPKCDGMKFIIISRDPYDCQYSFNKFFMRFNGGEEDLDEAMALDIFQLASGLGNDYFGIMTTWWAHRNDPNVLWIYYEDLKKDLRFCIEKIAQFMNIPLTAEELNRVYGYCTFEYMSKNDDKFAADVMLECIAKSIESERWSTSCGMVRKDGGKIGEGRKSVGPKLREAIKDRWDDTIGKELGFADYDKLYKETSFLKKHGKDISK